MKRIITTLAIVVSFSSCSVQVWKNVETHDQVMSGFKTRDQIVARFGLPTSKKTEGEYEEWLYDYGTQTVTDGTAVGQAYSGTNAYGSTVGGAVVGRTNTGAIGAVGGSSSAAAVRSGGVASTQSRVVTQEYKTFLKFTLKGNNVVTWSSKGLDYGKYEQIRTSYFKAFQIEQETQRIRNSRE